MVNDKIYVYLIMYSSMCPGYDYEQVNQVMIDDPSKKEMKKWCSSILKKLDFIFKI